MATKQPVVRVRFVTDPDGAFEECNGEARPLTEAEYAENAYMRDGQPIPYDEYLNYYGNPDRHVYLMTEVQKQCPCCHVWSYVAGTGRIDFMDDDPALRHTDRWFTPEQVLELPGHLREVALEDLIEAGFTPPRSIYCKHKGCKYWHVTEGNTRFCAQHQPEAVCPTN